MKKVIFMLAVATLSMTSCKKDYTCECTSDSPVGTSTSSDRTGKMSLSDARAKCNDGDKTTEVLGTTYTTECSLK